MQDNKSDIYFVKPIVINCRRISFDVDSGAIYSILNQSKMDTLLDCKISLFKFKIKLYEK